MEQKNFEIIIPAYNEEATIGGLIHELKSSLGDDVAITVVDDASLDKTAEISEANGARVIRHPYNMGNGATVRTGLRNATAEISVLMDADGQHRVQDVPVLLEYMDRFEMAIGARDFSRVSFRNQANRVYNLFASYVTLFPVKDLTSGFRAVKTKTAKRFLYLFPNGFSYPSTITLSFLKSGHPIVFVPVSAIPRQGGKSKINIIKDGGRFFTIITRIAVFFSPLRVFIPCSFFFFLLGLGYYLYTYVYFHRFTNMSALLFTTAIVIFLLGLISEQISQLRMDRTEE
ncbi:MAG: glycosyltransferase family 2 protein [Candidatus Omnitrophica bacterium]|nr:glycosyltransferase family 2 protein [Candidatus Omnitrophota bacterium]